MRISDWSSDVCSSDLIEDHHDLLAVVKIRDGVGEDPRRDRNRAREGDERGCSYSGHENLPFVPEARDGRARINCPRIGIVAMPRGHRSEEHTSELQSLMRISYAVFCLKTKK